MNIPRALFALTLSCGLVAPLTVHASAQQDASCLSLSNSAAEPPSGFSPLTATDQQLSCYGFPSRPSTSAALASWTDVMQHAIHHVPHTTAQVPDSITHQLIPVPRLGVTPDTTYKGTFNATNWAGTVAQNIDNSGVGNWFEVNARWNVPTFGTASSKAGYRMSIWPGMGGTLDASNQILQAGTDTINPGPGNPGGSQYFWWENYPHNNEIPLRDVAVHGGDSAYVDVRYAGNAQTAVFVEDLTTNAYTSYSEYSPDYNYAVNTADWIVEQDPGRYQNYGAISFGNCYTSYADSSGNAHYSIGLTTLSAYQVNTAYSGYLEAYPDAAVNGTYGPSFHVYSTTNAG